MTAKNKIKLFKGIEICLWIIFSILLIMSITSGIYILVNHKTPNIASSDALVKIASIFLYISPFITLLNIPLLFLKIKNTLKHFKIISNLEKKQRLTDFAKIKKEISNTVSIKENINNEKSINKKVVENKDYIKNIEYVSQFLKAFGISITDNQLIKIAFLAKEKASFEDAFNYIYNISFVRITENSWTKLINAL